jgi:hypothetical protein
MVLKDLRERHVSESPRVERSDNQEFLYLRAREDGCCSSRGERMNLPFL